MKYIVSLTDTTEYEIEANTPEQARLQALNWWDERTPYILMRDENGHLIKRT